GTAPLCRARKPAYSFRALTCQSPRSRNNAGVSLHPREIRGCFFADRKPIGQTGGELILETTPYPPWLIDRLPRSSCWRSPPLCGQVLPPEEARGGAGAGPPCGAVGHDCGNG